MYRNEKDIRIKELLTTPIHTNLFGEYKRMYQYITGIQYNGTCSSCGMKMIFKLMKRHNNKFN